MEKARNNILIIFTRYPRPGRSKTRLIPVLGPINAALLQKALTELTIKKIQPLENSGMIQTRVFFDGASNSEMMDWLGHELAFREQADGDLGYRMLNAFDDSFNSHFASSAVIIGTDIYELEADLINEAFSALLEADVVIGPAKDGGYYLIGLNNSCPELFNNISWGTSSVLKQTLARIFSLNMKVHILRTLHDIDRPDDLEHLDLVSLIPSLNR